MRGIGLEPQFDDIKRFIYSGGDYKRFVQPTEEPFVEELKAPNTLMKSWVHLLSAQYDYNAIEARMMSFAGPQPRPIVWCVKLGPSPSRVVGTFGKAFGYHYFEESDREGYVGVMAPLTLRNLDYTASPPIPSLFLWQMQSNWPPTG